MQCCGGGLSAAGRVFSLVIKYAQDGLSLGHVWD